jgi:PEP-CTERM motif
MKPAFLSVRSRWSLGGLFLGLLFMIGAPSPLRAAPLATAELISTDLGGGEFNYAITLNNVGSGAIGTFWYSWVPGQDFMSVSPTSIVSPTGWSANITHAGNSDGYAIQWIAASNAVASGGSAEFSFDSTMTPAQIAGDSALFPASEVGTSFVYSGGPFSDSGDEFVVGSVPEPSVLALLSLSVIGLFWLGWRRSKVAAFIA